MEDQHTFTIRVYALLVNKEHEILLMNESYRGIEFTKFPGGGLEWGEGLRDCVSRELHEELGLSNIDLQHYYTTDFFIESYFDTTTQVISVYYKTKQPIDKQSITLTKTDTRLLGFKWQALKNLSTRDVSFPIDKKVVEMLLSGNN